MRKGTDLVFRDAGSAAEARAFAAARRTQES